MKNVSFLFKKSFLNNLAIITILYQIKNSFIFLYFLLSTDTKAIT